MSKMRVSYFMDNDVGGYYYGAGHVMKPHRVAMTHNLVLAYGLYRKMDVYRPRQATPAELRTFHAADYVDFLRRVSPTNARDFARQLRRFNLGPAENADCPVFDGLYRFCQTYTGASIDGARKLMAGAADIAINWAGGLHHAKKSAASGFCYVNDIVVAVLDMLRFYPRVLYVDIDAHHGDGVEEAFYTTDRVMTVSFHRFGDGFFPSTGDVWDKGQGRGEYYAVNCPLKEGIADDKYESLFKPVMDSVMQMFRPAAIVLQCGTDSLAHDRIGGLNLSIKGHGKCVQLMKQYNTPMLVLGGGGYRIRNVSRCWAYETGLLLDTEIDDIIPFNDYWHYFEPDYKLHLPQANMQDENSTKYLEKLREKVVENLRCLDSAPSVQMQEAPPSFDCYESSDEEEANADQRPSRRGGGVVNDDSDAD